MKVNKMADTEILVAHFSEKYIRNSLLIKKCLIKQIC